MRYPPLWLQNQHYPAVSFRLWNAAIWPNPATSGAAVTAAGAMTVTVAAGSAAVPAANGTGTVMCVWDAPETVTLNPAPGVAGTNRIDLITVQVAAAELGAGSGDSFTFVAVTGAEAPSPVAPAVPAGAAVLAQITRPGGSAQITGADIADRRAGGLSLNEIWSGPGPVMAPGWVVAPGWPAPFVRRLGPFGFVEAVMRNDSGIQINTGITVLTLPVGLRPAANNAFMMGILVGTVWTVTAATIHPAGYVYAGSVQNQSPQLPPGCFVQFSAMFPLT